MVDQYSYRSVKRAQLENCTGRVPNGLNLFRSWPRTHGEDHVQRLACRCSFDLVDAPGAPYTAALNPHSTPYGYANIPASPVLTPVPGRTVAHDLVHVADPVVVAIQGGTVVARSVVPNHPDTWTGGLAITFPDPPALTRCPGVPAPTDGGTGLQGDYALRLVVDVTVTGAVPGAWLIASAPLP